jgi:23S rRNA pseudouridine1911/1915/1917 synthase
VTKLTRSFQGHQCEITYLVGPEFHQWRLDRFVQVHLKTLSREFVKKKIEKSEICILGRKDSHRPSTKVSLGDSVKMVTYAPPQPETECWRGEELALEQTVRILYEDADTVAISKPAFMSTHPSGKRLFYCATVYVETLIGRPVHSVHRLDRETSGVLVLGKDPLSSQRLSLCFEKRQVQKIYCFFGRVSRHHHLDSMIEAKERLGLVEEERVDASRVCVDWFPEHSDQGKASETDFRLLNRFPLKSSDEDDEDIVIGLAFPRTGRQHQIRVHAQVHGFPLIGDKLYPDVSLFRRFKDGESRSEDYDHLLMPRHALHAMGLVIEGKLFYDPLPPDMKQFLKEFGDVGEEEMKLLETQCLSVIQSIHLQR